MADLFPPEAVRLSSGHIIIKMDVLDAFELLYVIRHVGAMGDSLEPLVDALMSVGIFHEEDDSE
jgi:hypothetical protein